jgi:two-component system, LytTR family, response regulator
VTKIRSLIVDDEPLAREWMRHQLEKDPYVEVVGECCDGFQTVLAIESLRPDLVFLDVQMPGLDGFGVLDALESGLRSAVSIVFVSAYDHYAIRAFDVHAFDYILKPFGPERVQVALERFRAQRTRQNAENLEGRISALLEDLHASRSYADWLLVRDGPEDKSFFIRVADIDWIEAARNNVILHVGKASHAFRESMQGVAAKLSPRRFLRIHRSTIVNIERIKELRSWFNGEHVVVLKDGAELTASASYAKELKEFRQLGPRRLTAQPDRRDTSGSSVSTE